jgi:hypothetical protein
MRTHLDLFSGIGGFALAANWAGYTTIGFCEIDDYCQRVLRHHFPDVPVWGDVRRLSSADVVAHANWPASHSHSPGSDWARRMTATYGRKLSAYWLSLDPPDSWARTLLAISTWGSTTCYLTWKKSVTPAGRLLFRLVPSTPRTAGIGSGLWPTPNVAGGGNTCELTPHKGHYLRPSGEKAHLGLDQAAKMWPTPRAEFDSGRHLGQPDTLHSAVKLWGTPTSRDHKDTGNMENVPENGLLGRKVLNDARTYPTPQARDWKGAQGRAYKGESMDLPATVSVAGLKLNSAWVQRMMGYPDNWLTLDGEATR